MNKDLTEIISSTLEKVIESDLEKAVEKEVKKCLENVISDIFGYGSKSREMLKEKFSTQIGICLENLKIENYNTMVINAIEKSINGELLLRVEEQIKETVLSKIAILEKKEYKLSEIVNLFKEEVLEDMDEGEERELTVIVEKDGDTFTRIYLDKEENQSKYKCKYTILLYRGQVATCNPLSNPENMPYGFDKTVFALYANRAQITIDSFDSTVTKELSY